MIDVNQNHLKGNPFISCPTVPCNTPSDASLSSPIDTFFSPTPVPFSNDPFAPLSGQFGSSVHPFNGLTDSQYPQKGINLEFPSHELNGGKNQTPRFSTILNQTAPSLPQTSSPLSNGLGNSLLPMFQSPLLCKSDTMPPIVQNGGLMALCPPPPSSKCGRVQRRQKVNM